MTTMYVTLSMLSKLPPVVCLGGGGGGGGGATGLLNKGGGSNRLPVEFPQVQTSTTINGPHHTFVVETQPHFYALTLVHKADTQPWKISCSICFWSPNYH